MSSTPSTVRQRGGKKRAVTPEPGQDANGSANAINKIAEESKASLTTEWDYKLALVALTVLAFATRFWNISYPKEVVFDEVHFGKVCPSYFDLNEHPCSHRVPPTPLLTPSVCILLSPTNLLL